MQTIRFLLNFEPVEVADVATTTNLLTWLRTRRQLTGTKEGCAEGDCGACTVVVAELPSGDFASGEPLLRSVNACIQFVPALDGKAVFTVEYLKTQAGGEALHPVQQALVECHGSQCGFCTPGFVMSLWNLYHNHEPRHAVAADTSEGNASAACPTAPDEAAVRSAITGNLCRCTGYRPIIEAGKRMFELPALALDRSRLRNALHALRRSEPLDYQYGGLHFHIPRNVADLATLRAAKPQATLLAGCTDIGLWVNKQFREVGDLIHIGQVAELRRISRDDRELRIGAAVPLTDAYATLTREYPQLAELWERFASPPVRNAGTLGGNIANGSPIGDSMPALIALGARVVLRNHAGTRELPLEALYLDYMKKDLGADEFVDTIAVPLRRPGWHFRTYKLSKRFDSDISAVCAAFAINIDNGLIRSARIAFGGMAATPRRAPATESALTGSAWDSATLARAITALQGDYAPLTDMRASAGYRMRSAANLLRRFHLETRADAPLAAHQVNVFADVARA
ncbi:MAG: xanthine dehydrogenase small subunit [Rhodocyclaceae bacterium]